MVINQEGEVGTFQEGKLVCSRQWCREVGASSMLDRRRNTMFGIFVMAGGPEKRCPDVGL